MKGKMKKLFYICVVLFCLLTVSCGGELAVSLYTRDLTDVASARERILYTTVSFVVEGLRNEDDIEFLRENLNSFSNEHLTNYNYTKSLLFDVKVPIILYGTENEHDLSKDMLYIQGKENGDRYDFFMRYNRRLVSKINNYIYDNHYQNIDLSQFTILLELDNDSREDTKLVLNSSYVNGKAYPLTHEETLPARERLRVRLSDIMTKAISDTEQEYCILSIMK